MGKNIIPVAERKSTKFIFKNGKTSEDTEIIVAIVEDDKLVLSHFEIDTHWGPEGITMVVPVYKQRVNTSTVVGNK